MKVMQFTKLLSILDDARQMHGKRNIGDILAILRRAHSNFSLLLEENGIDPSKSSLSIPASVLNNEPDNRDRVVRLFRIVHLWYARWLVNNIHWVVFGSDNREETMRVIENLYEATHKLVCLWRENVIHSLDEYLKKLYHTGAIELSRAILSSNSLPAGQDSDMVAHYIETVYNYLVNVVFVDSWDMRVALVNIAWETSYILGISAMFLNSSIEYLKEVKMSQA